MKRTIWLAAAALLASAVGASAQAPPGNITINNSQTSPQPEEKLLTGIRPEARGMLRMDAGTIKILHFNAAFGNVEIQNPEQFDDLIRLETRGPETLVLHSQPQPIIAQREECVQIYADRPVPRSCCLHNCEFLPHFDQYGHCDHFCGKPVARIIVFEDGGPDNRLYDAMILVGRETVVSRRYYACSSTGCEHRELDDEQTLIQQNVGPKHR